MSLTSAGGMHRRESYPSRPSTLINLNPKLPPSAPLHAGTVPHERPRCRKDADADTSTNFQYRREAKPLQQQSFTKPTIPSRTSPSRTCMDNDVRREKKRHAPPTNRNLRPQLPKSSSMRNPADVVNGWVSPNRYRKTGRRRAKRYAHCHFAHSSR